MKFFQKMQKKKKIVLNALFINEEFKDKEKLMII